MSNYEFIIQSKPERLAQCLDGFDREEIGDDYCRNCPERFDGSCPLELGERCPIDNVKTIMWWLNQPIKEKENKK